MSWEIEPQVERHGQSETIVLCKRVKCYMSTHNGVSKLGMLNFPLFQVLIRHTSGVVLAIKWSGHGGFPGRWYVCYPDKVGKPKVWTMWKGRRVQADDETAEDVTIKGDRQEYTERGLREFLAGKAGGLMTEQIMGEFANRVAAVAYAKAA